MQFVTVTSQRCSVASSWASGRAFSLQLESLRRGPSDPSVEPVEQVLEHMLQNVIRVHFACTLLSKYKPIWVVNTWVSTSRFAAGDNGLDEKSLVPIDLETHNLTLTLDRDNDVAFRVPGSYWTWFVEVRFCTSAVLDIFKGKCGCSGELEAGPTVRAQSLRARVGLGAIEHLSS